MSTKQLTKAASKGKGPRADQANGMSGGADSGRPSSALDDLLLSDSMQNSQSFRAKVASATNGTLLAEMRSKLGSAARRLDEKGLLMGGESLSLRLAGQNRFLLAAADLDKKISSVKVNDIAVMEFSATPDSDDWVSELHAAIHMHRGDVGAVFIGRQKWASALRKLPGSMPTIFDEQARQLGPTVESLEFRPGPGGFAGLQKNLFRGPSNAFLLGDYVIVLGMTLEKALFNAELLEKCSKAYVLARLSGQRIKRIPFYVRVIANRRLIKDETRAAASYAMGEIPGGFTAY